MAPKLKLNSASVRCALLAALNTGATNEDAAEVSGVAYRSVQRYALTNADFAKRLTLAQAVRDRILAGESLVKPDEEFDPSEEPTAGELSVSAKTGIGVDLIQTSDIGIPSGRLNKDMDPLDLPNLLAFYQRVAHGDKYPPVMRALAMRYLHEVYVEPSLRAQASRDRMASASIETTARKRAPGLKKSVVAEVYESIAGPPVPG